MKNQSSKMPEIDDSWTKFLNSLLVALTEGSFVKAVFSKPASRSPNHVVRLELRIVTIGEQKCLQRTRRIGNQDHHDNFAFAEAQTQLAHLVPHQFKDAFLRTQSHEFTLRTNRKGVGRLDQVQINPAVDRDHSDNHNRSKKYLIPDGKPVPFLVTTGIMTRAGRVRSQHFRKFRQINRYLEFVSDAIRRIPQHDILRIVDFGCGKSYLTFATEYLLTNILKRKCYLVGLDLRQDVVEKSRQMAAELSLKNIEFQQTSIDRYHATDSVHVAISLHACDTASDDALTSAVQWQADAILAAPCCHHELSAGLSRKVAPMFSQHGILHERYAAMATDALRSELLQACGYDTQVIEFIEMEHTPRNLLIKALRKNNAPSAHELSCNSDVKSVLADWAKQGYPELKFGKNLSRLTASTPSGNCRED